jgi:hypothetical protein
MCTDSSIYFYSNTRRYCDWEEDYPRYNTHGWGYGDITTNITTDDTSMLYNGTTFLKNLAVNDSKQYFSGYFTGTNQTLKVGDKSLSSGTNYGTAFIFLRNNFSIEWIKSINAIVYDIQWNTAKNCLTLLAQNLTNSSFEGYNFSQDSKIFLADFNPNGTFLSLKVIRTKENSNDTPLSFKLDDIGNCYVLFGNNGFQWSISKVDKQYNTIWSKELPGAVLNDFAVEAGGQFYISMNFCGNGTLGSNLNFTGSGTYSCGTYVAKFDTNGTALDLLQFTTSTNHRIAYNELTNSLWLAGKNLDNSNIYLKEVDETFQIKTTVDLPTNDVTQLTTDPFGNVFILNNNQLYKYQLQSLSVKPNNSISNLTIYPNPGSGTYTIEGKFQNISDATYSVYDSIGKLLKSETIKPINNKILETIDITDLKAGIYYIDVYIGNEKVQRKIIKNH